MHEWSIRLFTIDYFYSTYVPFSNRSVIDTWRKSRTRNEINICRIVRICETSSRSVRTDARIRKTFVGNADDDLVKNSSSIKKRFHLQLFNQNLLISSFCVTVSFWILFIDAISFGDKLRWGRINSLIDGRFDACWISDEYCSKRPAT